MDDTTLQSLLSSMAAMNSGNRPPRDPNDLFGGDLVATPYWKEMERGKTIFKESMSDFVPNERKKQLERKACDVWMECLLLSPTKWSPERYNTMITYTNIVSRESPDIATEKDLKYLHGLFANNEKEPALFRVRAIVALIGLELSTRIHKEANISVLLPRIKALLQLAETLFNGMSEQEGNRICKSLRESGNVPPMPTTVRDLMQDMKPLLDDCESRLKVFENMTNYEASFDSIFSVSPQTLHKQLLDFPQGDEVKFDQMDYMKFDRLCMAAGATNVVLGDVMKILHEGYVEKDSEPMLFRVRAACALVQMHWNYGETVKAREMREKALALMNSSSKSHKKKVVRGLRNYLDEEGSRPFNATVETFYEDLKELFLQADGPIQDQVVNVDNITPVEIKNILEREKLDMMTFSRMMIQGGDDCDYCGKSKEEVGIDRLGACVKCTLASYCSKRCQRLAWKAGHRSACREPGDVREGDLMKLVGLKEKPDWNHRCVKVLRRVDNCNNTKGPSERWQIRFFDDTTPDVSISTENLKHLRPVC